ncbi:MAG TPA: H-NS histone family protein [Gammaproteobacteria bacterium]|nr:H-NS histone family protein [Gammaproteobacteria bacterium]
MDLTNYNSQQLRELQAELDRELKKRRRDDVRQAQRELRSVAERFGFSLTELVSGQPAAAAAAAAGKGVVKFRHPSDESKTWSGRGRKPAWIKEWEAEGRSLDELLVD